jgi:hypothetical protein
MSTARVEQKRVIYSHFAQKTRSYFGIAYKGTVRKGMVNSRVFLIITLLTVDLLARFERASIFARNVSYTKRKK